MFTHTLGHYKIEKFSSVLKFNNYNDDDDDDFTLHYSKALWRDYCNISAILQRQPSCSILPKGASMKTVCLIITI